jgi:hypothetical protein
MTSFHVVVIKFYLLVFMLNFEKFFYDNCMPLFKGYIAV